MEKGQKRAKIERIDQRRVQMRKIRPRTEGKGEDEGESETTTQKE